MRTIKSVFIVLAVLIMIPGYGQDQKELRKKIEKINNEMADYLVKGDFRAGMAYYTDDAISMPNWSPMIRGKEAMQQENTAMENMGINFNHFDFNTMEVMKSGDMVIEIGTYKMSMNMPQTPETMHDQGKYVTVWEIQNDGSLKIKADIWNTDKNPMQRMGGEAPREEKMPHHDNKMHEKHDKKIKAGDKDRR